MAGASLDRFQAGVAISDTPISYTPGVGMNMAFTVTYHQRQNNQPSSFTASNLGQQWNGSWISSITGGPTNGLSDAVYNAPDGSQYTYQGYQRTVAQGLGVERLVYVACDAGALAGDAARLVEAGFRPKVLQLVDMFPGTHHLEAVMSFERAPETPGAPGLS